MPAGGGEKGEISRSAGTFVSRRASCPLSRRALVAGQLSPLAGPEAVGRKGRLVSVRGCQVGSRARTSVRHAAFVRAAGHRRCRRSA